MKIIFNSKVKEKQSDSFKFQFWDYFVSFCVLSISVHFSSVNAFFQLLFYLVSKKVKDQNENYTYAVRRQNIKLRVAKWEWQSQSNKIRNMGLSHTVCSVSFYCIKCGNSLHDYIVIVRLFGPIYFMLFSPVTVSLLPTALICIFFHIEFFSSHTIESQREREIVRRRWVSDVNGIGNMLKNIVISAPVTYAEMCRCLIPARLFKLLIIFHFSLSLLFAVYCPSLFYLDFETIVLWIEMDTYKWILINAPITCKVFLHTIYYKLLLDFWIKNKRWNRNQTSSAVTFRKKNKVQENSLWLRLWTSWCGSSKKATSDHIFLIFAFHSSAFVLKWLCFDSAKSLEIFIHTFTQSPLWCTFDFFCNAFLSIMRTSYCVPTERPYQHI